MQECLVFIERQYFPPAFLNKVFWTLAYFIIEMQRIKHTTCEISINLLFTLLERLPVRQTISWVMGESSVTYGVLTALALMPLPLVLLKGQL